GLISGESYNSLVHQLRLYNDTWISLILAAASVLGIILLIRFTSKEKHIKKLSTQNIMRNFSRLKITVITKTKKIRFYLSFQEIALLSFSIIMLFFLIFQVHQDSPLLSMDLVSNQVIRVINYFIQRYHILIVLTVLSFSFIKFQRRTFFTLILLSILSCFIVYSSWINSKPLIQTPIIFTIMALPTLMSLVKNRRRVGITVMIFIILLGVFSGGMYSSVVKSSEAESKYLDLPDVLTALLNSDTNGQIYTPKETYNLWRVVRMVNLFTTSNSSNRYCLIDMDETSNTVIVHYLNNDNYEVLYQGEHFILFERVYNPDIPWH
ncbi:MAG: hypothetical protein ACXADU_11525, partial [Promethearchaeota archaeon]